MTTHPSSPPPTDDTISLIEVANAILRNWRAVIALPLALALFVAVRGLNQKRNYYATATFVPQSAENRGLSGAAALAQQFGVNLGTERAGQSPQFYEGLLRASTILRRAVESEYEFPTPSGGTQRGTLIDYWRLNERPNSEPAWRRGVDRLRKALGTSVRRETGVIELTVTVADAPVAEQIATRLLDLLNDYNLEARQTRARDEARFTAGRLAESQGELRAAEDALENFLRRNRDFRNSPELSFQHDRLERQVAARQEVYAALLRAQEQARIDGMRDTPVLQVIDSPAGSAQPRARGLALRTVIAFMLGLLLAVALAAVREGSRRAKQSNDPHYRDFQNLVHRMWSDLRHPRRWIRRGDQEAAVGDD